MMRLGLAASTSNSVSRLIVSAFRIWALVYKPSSWLRFRTGEPGGTRTRDPVLKRHMLYHLSYRPISMKLKRLCFSSFLSNRSLWGNLGVPQVKRGLPARQSPRGGPSLECGNIDATWTRSHDPSYQASYSRVHQPRRASYRKNASDREAGIPRLRSS